MATTRKILLSDIDGVIQKNDGISLSKPYIKWVKENKYSEVVLCTASSLATSKFISANYQIGCEEADAFTSVISTNFAREQEFRTLSLVTR